MVGGSIPLSFSNDTCKNECMVILLKTNFASALSNMEAIAIIESQPFKHQRHTADELFGCVWPFCGVARKG